MFELLTINPHVRTDITFSLQYGSPTMFFRDRMAEVRQTLAAKGRSLSLVPVAAVTQCHRLDRYLEDILRDILSICKLFNNGLQGKTVDSMVFLDMIVSIFYRLLRFRPVTVTNYDQDAQTVHCMALLVFMMTVFLQHDSRRVASYHLIFRRFREVLEGNVNTHHDEFIFWTMFIVGIWVLDDHDANWVVPQIYAAAQRLDLHTWVEAKSVLCKFPWLDGVHDETGSKVWNQAQGGFVPTQRAI